MNPSFRADSASFQSQQERLRLRRNLVASFANRASQLNQQEGTLHLPCAEGAQGINDHKIDFLRAIWADLYLVWPNAANEDFFMQAQP